MRSPDERPSGSRTEAWVFVVLLFLGFCIAWYSAGGGPAFCREAIARTGVCRDMLDGLPRGRQGLLGSLYWAPLPTLLALPLVQLPGSLGGEWAHVMVAVVSGALIAACMSAWLKRCGVVAPIRVGVAVAVFLSPAIQKPALEGSSEVIFSLLTLMAFCFLVSWWETENLRSLAYLAIVVALAMVTRFQGILFLIVTGAAILGHLARRRGRRRYAEGTLIVFLLPPLYVAALWVISNWLIMGDPWFFLRGLPAAVGSEGWGGLITDGCEWGRILLLCGIALAGRAVAIFSTEARRRLAGVCVLLLSLSLWVGDYGAIEFNHAESEAELSRIVTDFRSTHHWDWLVVSGYRGYELTRLFPEELEGQLYHVLSFYRDRTLADTRGRRAYLLVPSPDGADRWEDVNVKFPDIFENGSAFTVYEKSWPKWRLWRLVRMDETDRR